MKILLVAPPSGFTDQLREGCIRCGHQVVYFNDRRNLLLGDWVSESVFLWRLSRRIPLFRRWNNSQLARTLLAQVSHERPDIVLINKGLLFNSETINTIRKRGPVVVNWFPENGLVSPYDRWISRTASAYDLVFSFDASLRDQVPETFRSRVRLLPFGVDAKYYHPQITPSNRELFRSRIVFVGAMYPERIPYLEAIRDLGLAIYGWHGWQHTSLAQYWRGPLSLSESATVYALADIVLNLNTEPPAQGVNLRTFEIPAAGGFQVSDYRVGVEGLFIPDREIVLCHSPSDLRTIVHHWLTRPDDERRRIARAGHERVLREHSIDHRIKSMIETIVEYRTHTT